MYTLEQHGSSTILHNFSVFLYGIHSKLQELPLVREKNSSGSLLIITAITWIEDLDAKLALLVGLFGSNGKAE